MKNKVLVTWDSNWADEMDISGFKIFNEDEWNTFKETVSKRKHQFTIFVGTNEDIDYDNGKMLLEELTIKKLSEDEYKVIKKFVGEEFGFTDFEQAYEEED